MVALFVQTLLLMAVAYFAGAALACMVRRSFNRSEAIPVPASAERRVDPLPEIVAQRAAAAARVGQGADAVEAPVPAATLPPRAHAPVTRPAVELTPPPVTIPLIDFVPATITRPALAPEPAEDLKNIHRIDAGIEAGLNRLGFHRYEEIAGWMRADVERVSQELDLGDRISRENWIEQAQVLAKGGLTYFAARRARGEAASAEPTADEGEPRRIEPASGGPEVSTHAAFANRAAELTMPPPAVPVRPAPAAPHDNLQRISGIDGGVEKLLAAQGVSRYSQIAHWSPADVQRFEALLGTAGRIGRENWIEQAQILSRSGDTAFSRDYDRRVQGEAADAQRPARLGDAIRGRLTQSGGEASRRSDIGALRSVRSEAYQTEAGQGVSARSAGRALRPPAPEDLKRIRGIGVLIEKRLNSMGITAYEQIANWTAEDIDRVSQSLDFKGRIERENWVEQARILASGGATEFSRRVDRGEVETSRYRP